jgi:hypothetical protein
MSTRIEWLARAATLWLSRLVLPLLAPLALASCASADGTGPSTGPGSDAGGKRDGTMSGGGSDGGHDVFVSGPCKCTGGLVCDPSGNCVPCASNAQCKAVVEAGTPACQLENPDAGSYKECVACTSTSPCASGEVCDLYGVDNSSGTPSPRTPFLCYADCRTTPDACAPGVSFCSPDSGLCGFGCLSTENSCALVGEKCNVDAGSCVECLTPSDCPINQPGCFANQCGSCGENSDCPLGQQCDVPRGLCHCEGTSQCALPAPACNVTLAKKPDGSVDLGCGCVSDAGACPSGTVCNTHSGANMGGECLPYCGHDGGPSCGTLGLVCHPDSGLCAACTSNAECTGTSGLICLRDGGAAGTCSCMVGQSSTCPTGTACSPLGGCTPSCTVDGGKCGTGVCDEATGACVGCVHSSDCAKSVTGTVCDNGDGGTFTCICHSPSDCLTPNNGCSTLLKRCGLCDSPADCPSTNPGCNSDTASCGSCTGATDCPASASTCSDAGACGS